MSLFPAYANRNETEATTDEPKQSWLENSSFNINLDILKPPESKKPKTHKHKTHKRKKEKKRRLEEASSSKNTEPVVTNVSNIWDDFKIDTTRNGEFLTVKTISRPSAPIYHTKFYLGDSFSSHKRKKKKFKRYYQFLPEKNSDNEEKITKKDLDKPVVKEQNENFTGFKQEEEMSQMTAYYNKQLADNPHNVEMWLKYVNFQDSVFQFEKTFRKGSMAKGLRVMAERKLSILDRALSHNPNCEELLRERLNIIVSVYPADELQVEVKKLVEKDQGNIILWQGYIEATQCSMSHCNTPAVLSLYTKCLSTLHKLRRTATVEKSLLEENILRMLYQCGLFLKQAGLFEQLWTLLRMYLELNLSPGDKTKFNIDNGIEEKQLEELEEVVLSSQLPIHELWLRIEKLRESCHWLPYSGSDTCEDPQRLVFSEDVAELIHPITVPENLFKLTATILTLLKIPLLPCRHNTMQDLGLDYVPWALDSVESILPVFLPLFPIDLKNKHLLKDCRLAVAPQYLKVLPGQEEYLQFLLTIMKNCAICLNGNDKIAVTIWWFRFQRILLILERDGSFKMTQTLKKRIKSGMKGILKEDFYRNNIIFYQEYALVEYELGNYDAAINILITAISMVKPKNLNHTSEEYASLCAAYRCLIELHLNAKCDIEKNKQKALECLIELVLEKKVDVITQDILNEAFLKFKHVKLILFQKDIPKLTPVQHFLPNLFTDWIILYGWFIYLTKGLIESGTFIEKTLERFDEKVPEKFWQKEVLFEFYVAILFKHCLEKPGYFKLLDDTLHRAIENYPNNLFFLTVLSKEQSLNYFGGQSWWKLRSLLLKTGRALPVLFLILIANQHITEVEENWVDTVTGQPPTFGNSLKNRVLSLFRRVTRSDMCTRRCGLVWRLYLEFVHTYFNPTLCRNVYYTAVEECPWLKALYIDAAIYIPAELAQIQDLLLEKQLRLHVTPEELDILRN